MTETVHRLKITLHGIKPPIWRRIEVASDVTLGELSPVLEAAMAWLGGYLHVFDVGRVSYGTPDPDWDTDDLDENEYRLGAVLPMVGAKMRWDYDFGDGWEHNVVVEAIAPVEDDVLYPRCLAGRRACPPEDCGGLPGYADILEALADPDNPEHADLREWLPLDYDPEYFDVAETDVDLRSVRPLVGWWATVTFTRMEWLGVDHSRNSDSRYGRSRRSRIRPITGFVAGIRWQCSSEGYVLTDKVGR